jgi:hypothetical protein
MFNDEAVIKYEYLFKQHNIQFSNDSELKSILNQMYQYAQLVYEQFKINNKDKNLSYEI